MQIKESNKTRVIKAVRITSLTGASILLLFAIFVYAVYHGLIQLNHPSERRYPVRGVDVSHYQGTIDWTVLAAQEIDFAYIKATEGSSFTDGRFAENWEAASKTGIKIGAYHFFSFDSPADSQLKHFTETVPSFRQMLPPVVDFEFYGDKKANPPDRETVCAQLETMLRGLEAYYGIKPIIYGTEDTFRMYLKGRFEEYPLWIRSVVKKPDTGGRNWLFWQYTNRERLDGYQGGEVFIDVNVFNGSRSDWESWCSKREKNL